MNCQTAVQFKTDAVKQLWECAGKISYAVINYPKNWIYQQEKLKKYIFFH